MEGITRKDFVDSMQTMKSGKASGLLEVSQEIIVARAKIGIQMIMDLCQCVLYGRGMFNGGKSSVIEFIFKPKLDVMNCDHIEK